MSFMFVRSQCTKCGHELGWKDLIPVFSWLMQKGKCRYCSEKISVQYPIVELLFGIIYFSLSLVYFDSGAIGPQMLLEYLLILLSVSALLIISIYDILYLEIMDNVVIPVTFIILVTNFFDFGLVEINSALLGAFIVYSFFYLQIFIPTFIHGARYGKYSMITESAFSYILFPIWMSLRVFVSEEKLDRIKIFQDNHEDDDVKVWIGGGDLRVAFLIGFMLGWKMAVVALFISYVVGSVIGITIKIMRQGEGGNTTEVPFIPFLCTGVILALIWGQDIYDWYFGYLMNL